MIPNEFLPQNFHETELGQSMRMRRESVSAREVFDTFNSHAKKTRSKKYKLSNNDRVVYEEADFEEEKEEEERRRRERRRRR